MRIQSSAKHSYEDFPSIHASWPLTYLHLLILTPGFNGELSQFTTVLSIFTLHLSSTTILSPSPARNFRHLRGTVAKNCNAWIAQVHGTRSVISSLVRRWTEREKWNLLKPETVRSHFECVIYKSGSKVYAYLVRMPYGWPEFMELEELLHDLVPPRYNIDLQLATSVQEHSK